MQNGIGRSITDSTFIVLAHGNRDSPPASGLVDYLLARGAQRVRTVYHPLTAEDGNRHEITTHEPGCRPRTRTLTLPTRPPYTFPLDALVPVGLARVDGWFAFNNLLCARGLLERRAGRAEKVVYWAVDFVPDRFGAGAALTRAYDRLDAFCCRHVDLRIELSQAMLEGRDARHGIAPEALAPRMVAPIGTWIDRVEVTPEDGHRSRRVVFIGHLVERMGVGTVIEAMSLLAARNFDVVADIAGRGPLEEQLRTDVERRGLKDRIRFHGFIAEHRKLEGLLARAAVGLAPYSTRVESFTRYADPSKLKSYMAAGLPILLTDVPPNADELARHGGAEVLADEPAAFANAIEGVLADTEEWRRRRLAARRYAQQFDWGTIVGGVLKTAGFEC